MSQAQLAHQLGRSERWVRKIEAGETAPNVAELGDLAMILRTEVPVILDLAPMPARGAIVVPSNDHAAAGSSAEELARLAEETSIGSGTVSDVEEATFRLRRAYSRTPPIKLASDLRARLASNQRLLGGVVRFSQRRDLMESTGWAALLLGTVCFDMEDRSEAWSYRGAALAIAQELGHGELEAWCWETAAWFALADDLYRDAIRYSEAGIPGAPMASVRVALHLQVARAAARLGDASATGAAIRAASSTLERLPDSEDNGDHYRFDAGKLPGFAAAAYVAIGEGRLAAEQARQSLAISGDPNSASYRPMRVNSAHADLGHAALLLGDVDEAVVEGSRALIGPMLHPEAIKRVRELAAALQPHVAMPEVRLLLERARAAVPR